MPRYYTGTTFYGGGYGKPNFPYGASPAVLFFDSEASLPFTAALAGVQAYVDEPIPMLYRQLGRVGGRTEWVFTPSIRLPVAGSTALPTGSTLIANILDPKSAEMPVDTPALYDGCLQLMRMMKGCPCPLANDASYKVSKCEELVLYPALNIVPAAELMRRKFSREEFLPPANAPKIAGFTYISPAILAKGTGKKRREQYIENLRTDQDFIDATREEASERAQAAAKTRKLKKTKCTGCLFEGKCSTYAVEQCDGIKTHENVREHMLTQARNMRVWLPQRPTSFTPQQRNTLLSIPSTYRVWDAYAYQISSRKTQVHLGHFCGDGAFALVAATGDRTRTERFYSWDSLREAVPELEEYPDIPEPQPWQLQAYEVAVAGRSRPRRTMSGWYEDALTCIVIGERTVTVHYGNRNNVSNHSEQLMEHDWFMSLYRISKKVQPHLL